MYSIYKIENVVNGKLYIGYTSKTVGERFKEHVASARRDNTTTKIGRAIRKYGSDNFRATVLETTSCRTECNQIEDKYIVELNTIKEGYNITRGGQGGLLVLYPENPNYDAIRAKMSASHLNKSDFYSELAKANHKAKSIGMHDKKHSEETKDKIRNKLTGIKHTEAHVKAANDKRKERRSSEGYVDPRKGKPRILKMIDCEYCGRNVNITDYKRNHFQEKCKKPCH